MLDFCTYFDSRYLARGLALYQSLEQHCRAFRLWVLCLDDTCHDTLRRLNLTHMRLIGLEEFERDDAALVAAKATRTAVEYYFTCTPSLPLYVFRHHLDVDKLVYLDADLHFFGDPGPIYDEFLGHSILIVGHRFPPALRHLEQFGTYNVGLLGFRRDDNALGCLRWWRERCLEWCHDRLEDGRFADQKYLDDWPQRFSGVRVVEHRGVNLAPWNVAGHTLTKRDGRILADADPLICYHFHGLKLLGPHLFDTGLANYGVRAEAVLRNAVYAPYARRIHDLSRRLVPIGDQTLRNSAPLSTSRTLRRALANDHVFLVAGPIAADLKLGWAARPLLSFRAAARHFCGLDSRSDAPSPT